MSYKTKNNRMSMEEFDIMVRGFESLTLQELKYLPRSRKEAQSEGLDIYFNGICESGHFAIRKTKNGRCISCEYTDKQIRYKENKQKLIRQAVEYSNRRYREDPIYRVKRMIRYHLLRTLNYAKVSKTGKTFDIIGYSVEEFMENIESKFKDGMTWQNHGEVWELDHIQPLASFEINSIEDAKLVNSLDNLMPLFIMDHKLKTISDIKEIAKLKAAKNSENYLECA